MTAQLLTSELSTLIQESKRKNPDLRAAAERSLNDLKALTKTSEAQIAADLKSRPVFVKPFLLACTTRNAKFAGTAAVCLQRIVVANALPGETLAEVLEAFRECATLALDIQLKVLQALPSLLQNYAGSLSGQLLVAAFQVCFLLYSSRTAVVSNTAAAAIQQLVSSTLEKAAVDDDGQLGHGPAVEVLIGDGTVSMHGKTLDAYRLLDDICLLTDGQKPKFLPTVNLIQNYGLELLESVLANHSGIIMAHPEQIHVLRLRLMPLIAKILSEKSAFSSSVRAMRLLRLIVSRLLSALASECEMVLSLLNHMLDPDAAALWKRVLCLELFRGIHSDPTLVRSIYAHFDAVDEQRNIIRDHLGSLVRLASEKPTIIGLGQQSSAPISTAQDEISHEQAAIQAGGLIGIGAVPVESNTSRVGISSQWSTIRIPCIDQLDKSEPPTIPVTYIYSLALTCITMFSEGLARFLLPFTVPIENKAKRKQATLKDVATEIHAERKAEKLVFIGSRRMPVNPFTLRNHVLYDQILTSSHMVEHCWPALLAASSTYLNATLDAENFHTLIRSFQKFTQIAGLLDLATPRDAFLTTLGKSAVPAINTTVASSQIGGQRLGSVIGESTDSDRDSGSAPNPQTRQPRKSVDLSLPILNTRHLLCLRALLNLGIALGPVLRQSWTIILETLQQADLIVSLALGRRNQGRRSVSGLEKDSVSETGDGVGGLRLEITAAETAASRLFESTADLPNDAFMDFLGCICSLFPVGDSSLEEAHVSGSLNVNSPVRKHQKVRSVSGVPMGTDSASHSFVFLLDKVNDTIQNNVMRLLQPETTKTGWNFLSEKLTSILGNGTLPSAVRIKAAKALDDLVVIVAVSEEDMTSEERDAVRGRSLQTLANEVSCLGVSELQSEKTLQSCEFEMHRLSLEALRIILEHCGDTLEIGWTSVLTVINSVFDKPISDYGIDATSPRPRSHKLLSPAFGSLQLICSDFLSSVPSSHTLSLIDTLHSFSAQDQDLNISLTTATFFRNVSDFLQRDGGSIDLDFLNTRRPTESDLKRWANAQNDRNSTNALWLYVLLHLTLLPTDSRLEVRHSALHTLFRIFDACSEQLPATAVQICFNIVLVKLLDSNELQRQSWKTHLQSNSSEDLTDGWNETAIVKIEGLSSLFNQWLIKYKANPILAPMLQEFFDQLISCLKRRSLSVSNAIFNGMSKVLTEIEDLETIGKALWVKAWQLWKDSNPASHVDDSQRKNGNHDTIMAYMLCLGQLLRLIGQDLQLDQTRLIMLQLRACVVGSNASAYSTDVDRMTPVQGLVLETLKSIPTKTPELVPELVGSINGFLTLAYKQKDTPAGKTQTYIALSKATMDLLESFIVKHIERPRVDATALVTEACLALAIPLHLKYRWHTEGKGPSQWQKATLTALAILEVFMPTFPASQYGTASSAPFWKAIVKIGDGVVAADCDACSNPQDISKDQVFDIAAFQRFQKLVIPALGSSLIADVIRRKYAESIFTSSMIHEPHPDDLPRPDQELLEGLRSTHIGRVQELPPSHRSKLSYILLDELFDLVAVHDGSPERVRLSQAAAPFLILRSGLTLKAYIMDQPLRGRMPQPWSQKKEMLHLLRNLIDLDSEPKAIPAAIGVTSEHKKHLHRLYPLVTKALKAAWRDEEMTHALREVLDAVGDDFGL